MELMWVKWVVIGVVSSFVLIFAFGWLSGDPARNDLNK
jgi:hypothetical protein